MAGINYKERKLSNVVALLAQHITLFPIITTIAAKKSASNHDEILFAGQAINQAVLGIGFLIGTGFLTKHLINKGQTNAAIALAITLTAFVSFVLPFLVTLTMTITEKEVKVSASAIAGNPFMWPLIGVASAVDSVYDCCKGRSS